MSQKITIYSCTLMIINVDSCMYNIIQCSSYFIHLDPLSSFIMIIQYEIAKSNGSSRDEKMLTSQGEYHHPIVQTTVKRI